MVRQRVGVLEPPGRSRRAAVKLPRSFDTLPVEGRRVLVRADLNVPLSDGRIGDDTRIRAALPTLEALRARGARVIVCSHLGRPKGEFRRELSLRPVAARLAELLGAHVEFASDCIGPVAEQAVHALADGRRAAAREPALPSRASRRTTRRSRRRSPRSPTSTSMTRSAPSTARTPRSSASPSCCPLPPATCCAASSRCSASCSTRRRTRSWSCRAASRSPTRSG